MPFRKYPECILCSNNKFKGFGHRKEGGCLYPANPEYGLTVSEICKDFKPIN